MIVNSSGSDAGSGEEIRIIGIALTGAIAIAFAQGIYGLIDMMVGILLLLIVHTVDPLKLRNSFERFVVWPAVWGFCFLIAFAVVLDRILIGLGLYSSHPQPYGFPVFDIALVLIWIVASLLAAVGVAIYKGRVATGSQQTQTTEPAAQRTKNSGENKTPEESET